MMQGVDYPEACFPTNVLLPFLKVKPFETERTFENVTLMSYLCGKSTGCGNQECTQLYCPGRITLVKKLLKKGAKLTPDDFFELAKRCYLPTTEKFLRRLVGAGIDLNIRNGAGAGLMRAVNSVTLDYDKQCDYNFQKLLCTKGILYGFIPKMESDGSDYNENEIARVGVERYVKFIDYVCAPLIKVIPLELLELIKAFLR